MANYESDNLHFITDLLLKATENVYLWDVSNDYFKQYCVRIIK